MLDAESFRRLETRVLGVPSLEVVAGVESWRLWPAFAEEAGVLVGLEEADFRGMVGVVYGGIWLGGDAVWAFVVICMLSFAVMLFGGKLICRLGSFLLEFCDNCKFDICLPESHEFQNCLV